MKKFLLAIILLLIPLSVYAVFNEITGRYLTGTAYSYTTYPHSGLTTTYPPRDKAGTIFFNNRIFMYGGCYLDDNQYQYNDCWESLNGADWTVLTKNAEFGYRRAFAAVAFKGKMYLIGGEDSNTVFHDDVWSSKTGITWIQETAAAGWQSINWRLNDSGAATIYNNEIWIVGSQYQMYVGASMGVWHSADGITWTNATNSPAFGIRDGQALFTYNGLMYVVGGVDAGTGLGVADVWHSSDGINWYEDTSTAAFGASQVPHIMVTANKVYNLFGDYFWESTDCINWTNTSMNGDFLDTPDVSNYCSLTGTTFANMINANGYKTMGSTEFDSNEVYQFQVNPTYTFIQTPSPTPTPYQTRTSTPQHILNTFTITPQITITLTRTLTPQATITNSPMNTFTGTATISPTWSISPTITMTSTITPYNTVTLTSTISATSTVSPTATTISTPFLQHLSTTLDEDNIVAYFQWQLYPDNLGVSYVLSYGATLQFREFINNSQNESTSPDRFVYPLADLKVSGIYPVQLQVQTTYPSTTMNSNIITVDVQASPTP